MSIRDYDRERMRRLADAFFKAMIEECRDAQGTVFIPSAEVLDAMALLGGVILSTGPASNSATRLREITTDFGKRVAKSAREAKSAGAAQIFDVVLDERSTFQ